MFEVVVSADANEQDFPQKACDWAMANFGYFNCSENRLIPERDVNLKHAIGLLATKSTISAMNTNMRKIVHFLNTLPPSLRGPPSSLQYCTVYFDNEKDAATFKLFWG